MDLFRSETLAVRARVGRGPTTCFVVFDPMGEDHSLDRQAFGEVFFDRYGIDAIHVLSTSNGWYQDPGLPAALAAIRARVTAYERVVTYGSSMGGYAALRFGAEVGAHAAIAISPQYSVYSDVIPFEARWLPERRVLSVHHEQRGQALPFLPSVTVFHDPYGPDGLHVAAILRDLPHACAIPLPHAGHPAGAILVETGLLSSVVRDAATGRLDPVALQAAVRMRRHRSGHYLFTLARRQPLRRLRTKGRLARRAVAAVPGERVYLSYAGLVAECLDGRDALDLHHAATRSPGFATGQLRYAQALWRAGFQAEAMNAVAGAKPQLEHDEAALSTIGLLDALDGRPDAFLARKGISGLMSRPWLARQLLKLARSGVVGARGKAALGRLLARWAVPSTSLDRRNILDELSLADRE